MHKKVKESEQKKRGFGILTEQPIERHKYTDTIVVLTVQLYLRCKHGLRGTVEALSVFNDVLNLEMEELPSYTTVANWVQKTGYYVYEETSFEKFKEAYATIIDESMMVGSEKFLLTLGVPALKSGNTSLTIGDVHILDMSVASTWNSKGIEEKITEVSKKMGSPPSYIISDNGSTIKKSARDKEYIHVYDIGHTISLFLQQVYGKDEDFTSLMKEINAVKFKEIMRKTTYLFPPTPTWQSCRSNYLIVKYISLF